MGKLIIGAKEICRRIGCSESTMMSHITTGGLPVEKVGGEWREVKPGAIDRWLGAKEAAKEKAEAEPKAKAKTDRNESDVKATKTKKKN